MKKRMRHFTHVLEQKDFFSNFRKIFQTKEMHLIALIKVYFNNWPPKSKRFNHLLKTKIQPLTARADAISSTCSLHLVVC